MSACREDRSSPARVHKWRCTINSGVGSATLAWSTASFRIRSTTMSRPVGLPEAHDRPDPNKSAYTPGLDKAQELLVLLTPWALDRPYIWAEVGAAWSRRIPIIPVLHGLTVSDLQARPGIPVLLKKRDMIESFEKGSRKQPDRPACDSREYQSTEFLFRCRRCCGSGETAGFRPIVRPGTRRSSRSSPAL